MYLPNLLALPWWLEGLKNHLLNMGRRGSDETEGFVVAGIASPESLAQKWYEKGSYGDIYPMMSRVYISPVSLRIRI